MLLFWTPLQLLLCTNHFLTHIVAAETTMHPTKQFYYAVTGANAGLGLESVRQLAALHAVHTIPMPINVPMKTMKQPSPM